MLVGWVNWRRVCLSNGLSRKYLAKKKARHLAITFAVTGRSLQLLLHCCFFADLIVGASLFLSTSSASLIIAITLIIWGFVYFILVVATIPFLISHDFRPDAIRLIKGHRDNHYLQRV